MTTSVLIVDDEPDVVLLSRVILEPAGYRVLEASDGSEALDLLQRESPDVLLLDVRMPRVDGWEVLERLGPHRVRDLGVVMFSAHAESASEQRALAAGCRAYLRKPFSPQALLQAVAGATDSAA